MINTFAMFGKKYSKRSIHMKLRSKKVSVLIGFVIKVTNALTQINGFEVAEG